MKIGMDLSARQTMSQKQILAPCMIQSMEILQLPIAALQERIEKELQENPVLELKDTAPASETGSTEAETDGPTANGAVADDKFNPDAPLKHDATDPAPSWSSNDSKLSTAIGRGPSTKTNIGRAGQRWTSWATASSMRCRTSSNGRNRCKTSSPNNWQIWN